MGARRNNPHHRSRRPNVNKSSEPLDWQLDSLKRGCALLLQISLGYQLYEDEHRQHHQPKKPLQRSRRRLDDKVVLSGLAYINAHNQFIVDPTADLRMAAFDANVPPEKLLIIRVVRSDSGVTCPICLGDEVVAPRMIALCGHIMCLKCLLSLLDSEVPAAKKREAKLIVEKYRECPLCSCIIRKTDVLPVVLTNSAHATPSPDQKCHLQLMNRPHNRVVAIPAEYSAVHEIQVDFPTANSEPDLSLFLRIVKGTLDQLYDFYAVEKEHLLANHAVERELYKESDKYLNQAISHIEEEINHWTQTWGTQAAPKTRLIHEPPAPSFKFYQAGPSVGGTVYVLAQLDIKVLKTACGHYDNFPSELTTKIENILYDELTQEKALGKYKYLAHLPAGTQIGFMECNWRNNPVILPEVWAMFEQELTKRLKKASSKRTRDERNRKKALAWEEQRTREFYHRENTHPSEIEEYEPTGGLGFGSLLIRDFAGVTELPELSPQAAEVDESRYKKLVWGTTVLKLEEDDQDELEAAEMIRKAKEEMARLQQMKGGKKKKRIVLASTL